MVGTVGMAETSFEDAPLRFEAGTPNYVGAISLGAAFDYLSRLGRDEVRDHEHELLAYAEERLDEIDGLHVVGNPLERAGCLSFTCEGVHPFDLATLLDKRGIAVRSGNQCAQPLLHEFLGVRAVTRVSPAFYNTIDDIDTLVDEVQFVLQLLRR
jgi:cysteine desulfurase/selenocysteine lyase